MIDSAACLCSTATQRSKAIALLACFLFLLPSCSALYTNCTLLHFESGVIFFIDSISLGGDSNPQKSVSHVDCRSVGDGCIDQLSERQVEFLRRYCDASSDSKAYSEGLTARGVQRLLTADSLHSGPQQILREFEGKDGLNCRILASLYEAFSLLPQFFEFLAASCIQKVQFPLKFMEKGWTRYLNSTNLMAALSSGTSAKSIAQSQLKLDARKFFFIFYGIYCLVREFPSNLRESLRLLAETAVFRNEVEILKDAVRQGYSEEDEDGSRPSVMALAAAKDAIDCIRFLVKSDFSPFFTFIDHSGTAVTAISSACAKGSLESFDFLLQLHSERGSEIEAFEECLKAAASRNRVDLMGNLLQKASTSEEFVEIKLLFMRNLILSGNAALITELGMEIPFFQEDFVEFVLQDALETDDWRFILVAFDLGLDLRTWSFDCILESIISSAHCSLNLLLFNWSPHLEPVEVAHYFSESLKWLKFQSALIFGRKLHRKILLDEHFWKTVGHICGESLLHLSDGVLQKLSDYLPIGYSDLRLDRSLLESPLSKGRIGSLALLDWPVGDVPPLEIDIGKKESIVALTRIYFDSVIENAVLFLYQLSAHSNEGVRLCELIVLPAISKYLNVLLRPKE
jgi:hypothetical protein